MHKDFEGWQQEKKQLHFSRNIVPFFNETEIRWCSLGINIGQEQDGKNNNFERPVLILRKFSKDILWILPMTSRIRNDFYHFPLTDHDSSVILSQIKLISSKRLLRRIRVVSSTDFKNIVSRVQDLLIKRNPA